MAEIGTVITSTIGPNRDQTTNVRLVRCTMSSEDDVQTIQLAGCVDQSPLEGTQILVFDVGLAWKIGFVLKEGVIPSAANGEKYLAAIVASAIVSSVKCKADGTTVVNDGEDSAVAYSRLKTAFDQLKSDHDNLVSLHNAHIHITTATIGASPTPGAISPTTSTGTPSTADMSSSESGTVKIP